MLNAVLVFSLEAQLGFPRENSGGGFAGINMIDELKI